MNEYWGHGQRYTFVFISLDQTEWGLTNFSFAFMVLVYRSVCLN